MTTNKDSSLPLPFELGSRTSPREDPTPIPTFDGREAEELDPVCTVEFAHYARALDACVRTSRRR